MSIVRRLNRLDDRFEALLPARLRRRRPVTTRLIALRVATNFIVITLVVVSMRLWADVSWAAVANTLFFMGLGTMIGGILAWRVYVRRRREPRGDSAPAE
jgi:hypothetical protein